MNPVTRHQRKSLLALKKNPKLRVSRALAEIVIRRGLTEGPNEPRYERITALGVAVDWIGPTSILIFVLVNSNGELKDYKK